MEDLDEYYDGEEDFDDDRSDDQTTRKIVYPPRLMVDFTRLNENALRRYAQNYQLNVRDTYDKDELAALVARHFDCSLDVEEDESILSFMARVRNGAKAVVHHRPPERAKGDKKRNNKKSNSQNRKRPRLDDRESMPRSQSNGSTASHKSNNENDRKHAATSNSSSSSAGLSSQSSHGHHQKTTKKGVEGKKPKDNGEDNELYCICKMPSYGNMIACDGKDCRNPSQWYHLECVGFTDGHNPETWLCPECDPEGFAEMKKNKKKNKMRNKSPGTK